MGIIRGGIPVRRYLSLPVYTLFLVATLALSGCGNQEDRDQAEEQTTAEQTTAEQPAAAYTDINVEELREMMDNESITLVNVHVPFEGDIPGTDVSIPFDEIGQHLDQLPRDMVAPVVLYCRSDRMSTEAANTLANLGFTNLYNLDGGFRAWTAAGYDLEMEGGG
jgi:rhodanese-related sulfurtransferase